MPHGKARRKLPSPRATHGENIPEGRNDLPEYFFSQLFYFCGISRICSILQWRRLMGHSIVVKQGSL